MCNPRSLCCPRLTCRWSPYRAVLPTQTGPRDLVHVPSGIATAPARRVRPRRPYPLSSPTLRPPLAQPATRPLRAEQKMKHRYAADCNEGERTVVSTPQSPARAPPTRPRALWAGCGARHSGRQDIRVGRRTERRGSLGLPALLALCTRYWRTSGDSRPRLRQKSALSLEVTLGLLNDVL
jgi:hypothetical protein